MAALSPTDPLTARFIEEISLNAWPSLQTVCYDGWLLRFAGGYTRRANSINPIYHSSIDAIEKIKHCEHVYTSRGLSIVFKITPAAQPENLDAILAEQGYTKDALTSVQTLSPVDVDPPNAQALAMDADCTENWLATFCQLNGVDGRHLPTMRQMLRSIVDERCFLSLRSLQQADETIATGLAVLERGWVGLFDVVTAPQMRNQGLGTQLVQHLLGWGQTNGADHAYLQVMCNNPPALHLYARLGFQEAYTYWYRVKPIRR